MKSPTLTRVNSSHIDAIGHDKDGLLVRFKGGSLFRYEGVPKDVFQAGLDAAKEGKSVGSWFHGAVRGRYKHQALD